MSENSRVLIIEDLCLRSLMGNSATVREGRYGTASVSERVKDSSECMIQSLPLPVLTPR